VNFYFHRRDFSGGSVFCSVEAVHKSFVSSLTAFPTAFVATMEMSTTAHATGKEATSLELNEVNPKDNVEEDAGTPEEYVDGIDGYTKRDYRHMTRMGKRQELMRNFRPLSALSFTVLLQATWEFLLM
jgi:hypothetical protein